MYRRNSKSYDPLYFSFLGGVILLQLFWIPAPFRDIGCCLWKPAHFFFDSPFNIVGNTRSTEQPYKEIFFHWQSTGKLSAHYYLKRVQIESTIVFCAILNDICLVVGVFYFLNSILNPFLYTIMSQRFRRAFMDIRRQTSATTTTENRGGIRWE